MEATRAVAVALAQEGIIDILAKGTVLVPGVDAIKGPIRLRLKLKEMTTESAV